MGGWGPEYSEFGRMGRWVFRIWEEGALGIQNLGGGGAGYSEFGRRGCWVFRIWEEGALSRGLAAMRPACHLDTQNTVFDSLETQKFMSEFAEDDFS